MTAHRSPPAGHGTGARGISPTPTQGHLARKNFTMLGAYAGKGLGMRPTKNGPTVPMRMTEPLLHAIQLTLIVALRSASFVSPHNGRALVRTPAYRGKTGP